MNDDQSDARRYEIVYQAKVADELRSPFISTQQSLDLLHRVQTDDPLLRVLIDREVAHLSVPSYESFEARNVNPVRFVQSSTVKTGAFDAIDDAGLLRTVLEFTVTARCGMQDRSRRSMSERSFGLVNGDRVLQVNFADFQIANSGMLMHRM